MTLKSPLRGDVIITSFCLCFYVLYLNKQVDKARTLIVSDCWKGYIKFAKVQI